MKKFARATALTLIILNTSLAHQLQPAQSAGQLKPIPGKIRTATKNELVRPDVRLPPKPKLIRSNPHRFAAIRFGNADPWTVPDDEDVILDRHRARLVHDRNWDWDADVSDEVAVRLVVARARALAKYREKWT